MTIAHRLTASGGATRDRSEGAGPFHLKYGVSCSPGRGCPQLPAPAPLFAGFWFFSNVRNHRCSFYVCPKPQIRSSHGLALLSKYCLSALRLTLDGQEETLDERSVHCTQTLSPQRCLIGPALSKKHACAFYQLPGRGFCRLPSSILRLVPSSPPLCRLLPRLPASGPRCQQQSCRTVTTSATCLCRRRSSPLALPDDCRLLLPTEQLSSPQPTPNTAAAAIARPPPTKWQRSIRALASRRCANS